MKELPFFKIELPQPPLGNKILCAHQYGIYVLETGPCIWRGLACTHAGTGSVDIYDGIADARGFFPDGKGRLLYKATPSVMGMWMFDAGCHDGLTMIIGGDISPVSPFLSVTWLPHRPQERRIIQDNKENAKGRTAK